MKKLFVPLSGFDVALWAGSSLAVLASYWFFPDGSFASTVGSLIGVTSLIFIAKGAVIGQMLMVVFALFYGLNAIAFRYYGEMLTYLGLSLPAAVFNIYSWLKHPYRDQSEVEIAPLTPRRFAITSVCSVLVTVVFYFLLRALNTSQLLVSTFSVTTSFFAAALSFQRSVWYAIAYAFNDVVLIVLWGVTFFRDPSVLPILVCFSVFLLNDLHGFFSWKKMRKKQEKGL